MMMISSADIYLPCYDGDFLNGEMPFEEVVKLTQKRLSILKNLDTVYTFNCFEEK